MLEIKGRYCKLLLISLSVIAFLRYKRGVCNLLFNVLKNKLVIVAYKVSKYSSICSD